VVRELLLLLLHFAVLVVTRVWPLTDMSGRVTCFTLSAEGPADPQEDEERPRSPEEAEQAQEHGTLPACPFSLGSGDGPTRLPTQPDACRTRTARSGTNASRPTSNRPAKRPFFAPCSLHAYLRAPSAAVLCALRVFLSRAFHSRIGRRSSPNRGTCCSSTFSRRATWSPPT
jgi:hypothetical protein